MDQERQVRQLPGGDLEGRHANLFEEIRAQEWLNDTVTPVAMPANRCDPVYMKDGRTVTADAGAGANAIAGIALDIDSTGRVIVAARPFFVT